ncbi:MAG: PIN domain-containing protein [Bauldia sp.]
MKTTVEIADPVLAEARKLATREGTTLRALVEQGLRQVIADRKKQKKAKPFRMRIVTFGGRRIAAGVEGRDLGRDTRTLLSERRGVIAVDSNILIYAHRAESPFHGVAADRVSALGSSGLPWAIPWPCVHECLSIITNRRVFVPPTPFEEGLEFLRAVMESPTLQLLSETDRHWDELRSQVRIGRATGGLVHDARIAAICLQHGVSELWSADRDFSRFPASQGRQSADRAIAKATSPRAASTRGSSRCCRRFGARRSCRGRRAG